MYWAGAFLAASIGTATVWLVDMGDTATTIVLAFGVIFLLVAAVFFVGAAILRAAKPVSGLWRL